MTRIISLIPSATEIVAALGFADQLVGRSHECDFPASVLNLPILTEPKIDLSGDSRSIDERVKDVLRDALSVYRVDSDLLRDLKPDVVITQAQCEVCAVSLEEVTRVVQECLLDDTRVVSLEPNTLADVYADIQRVADALNVHEIGLQTVTGLQTRMHAIAEKTALLEHRPTVATIEWIDPLMAAGNWVPELVNMAGGYNLFGREGHHSPWLEWDDIWAHDPDRLIVMPCGFDIQRSLREMTAMTRLPGWNTLRAVREGQVYITDGNQYFNRPGPRLAESLEILAEIIHPELFQFGHHGTGWVKYHEQAVTES